MGCDHLFPSVHTFLPAILSLEFMIFILQPSKFSFRLGDRFVSALLIFCVFRRSPTRKIWRRFRSSNGAKMITSISSLNKRKKTQSNKMSKSTRERGAFGLDLDFVDDSDEEMEFREEEEKPTQQESKRRRTMKHCKLFHVFFLFQTMKGTQA